VHHAASAVRGISAERVHALDLSMLGCWEACCVDGLCRGTDSSETLLTYHGMFLVVVFLC